MRLGNVWAGSAYGVNASAEEASLSRTDYLRTFAVVTLILLTYRLILMWMLPLADTTEARYGEIAKLTLTHGFWLMPHIDVDTPFFAKPPLSSWAAAVSMYVFGINEFAARLPSLLASMLTAWLALKFAARYQMQRCWLVLPVLASCPLFFISAGAVMTDAIQMSVVTAALYFSWRCIEPEADGRPRNARRYWRLAFWTMVGIGALCKGLADWALIGMPLFAYAMLERRPLAIFRALFDWAGVLLALCIFIPWYLAAEYANPGFLNYFIVGEHFSRFLIPAWKGDRYGNAHVEPLGTIWLFWAAAILPWLGVFLTRVWQLFRGRVAQLEPLERFLWCAILTPLVFFSFAHNIIWTYGLTAIVPFSVMVARWLDRLPTEKMKWVCIAYTVLSMAAILCYPLILSNVSGNSERDLVAVFHREAPAKAALLYRLKPSYSAAFYGGDEIRYQPLQATLATEDYGSALEVVDNAHLGAGKIYFRGTRHSLVSER